MSVYGTIDTEQYRVKLGLHTGVITMSVTTKTRYGLILLVLSAVFACTNLQAGRPDRSPGVFIPIFEKYPCRRIYGHKLDEWCTWRPP